MEVTQATDRTFRWRVLRESGLTGEHKVGRHKAVALRHADVDTRCPVLLDAVLAATAPTLTDTSAG